MIFLIEACLPGLPSLHQYMNNSFQQIHRKKTKKINANLAPATLILLIEAVAPLTVVGHLLALVKQHMELFRVVQRPPLVPDDGEGGGGVGRPRGVGELHP